MNPLISSGPAKITSARSRRGQAVDLCRGAADRGQHHEAAGARSIRDPGNVRGAKDLLGHSSFRTTENHYVMAQSRLAGRVLALAIAGAIDTALGTAR